METPLVWVIMGSDSDLPIMADAVRVLQQYGVPHTVSIASAHRTTDFVLSSARAAMDNGLKVIIAGAGLAAHLPGVIAAATTLPVIGVPLQSGPLAGQDALYAIVQMPPGIPVATVAINGARNAALLAVEMLAISDENLRVKLIQSRIQMQNDVLAKHERLQEIGIDAYLADQRMKS